MPRPVPSLLKIVKHKITTFKDQPYYYAIELFLERLLERYLINDLYYITAKEQ